MVYGIRNSRIASKSFFRTIGLVLLLAVLTFRGFPAPVQASDPPHYVVVNESHMHGWAFVLTDASGVPYHTGGDYSSPTGTAQFVNGPAPTPDGTGSANLAVGDGISGGDGSAQIGTANFDGTLLSALTTLSYHAYSAQNNGQQFPYFTISISTGDAYNPITCDYNSVIIDPHGCSQDKLFFEPPYQTPVTGNPSCPDQGPTLMNMWQNWDALHGCWWDNNGIGNPGSLGVQPLSAFLSEYPNAVIRSFTASSNTAGPHPTQGLAFAVGYTSSFEIENGNVDFFLIGTSGATTHYDFEHITTCPKDEGDSAKQQQHEELCEEKADNGEHGNDAGEHENEQAEQNQHNSDASGEDLSGADYSGYDFSNSNLRGSDLSGSILSGVNLSGADLSCASLSGANLTGANLAGANLQGADLTGAVLEGANLTGVLGLLSLPGTCV